MVETVKTSRKTGPRNVDWIAVHELWSEGHGAEWIAERFGLTTRYVQVRLSWIDSHFPPVAPVRFKAALARRLDEALAALERGESVEAERKAKALQAILRAATAVEEWIMDNDAAAKPAEPSQEANAHDDPRAELERRIAHLLDRELKRRAAGSGAAESGPDSGVAHDPGGAGDSPGEPGAQ